MALRSAKATRRAVQRINRRSLSVTVSSSSSGWLGSYGSPSDHTDNANKTSNRQRFREIPISNKTLKHIESSSLCTPLRSSRKHLAQRMRRTNRSHTDAAEDTYPLFGQRSEPLVTFFGKSRDTKARLSTQARSEDDVPSPSLNEPEIAFAGRSNVGKSSLINCVTMSSTAKKSDRPGKTQSINFHRLAGRATIVDLPGYGFAFASDERIAAWNELMDAYLSARPSLRKVYLIADARVGLKQSDKEMLTFLHSHKLKVSVVLNKVDSLKPVDLARMHALVQDFMSSLKGANKTVFMVSAATGAGMQEVCKDVVGVAQPQTLKEIQQVESKAQHRQRIVAERKAAASSGRNNGKARKAINSPANASRKRGKRR